MVAVEPPAKRQRTEGKGFLTGVTVYVVEDSLANRARRLKLWDANLAKYGGRRAKDADDKAVTHVVYGDVPLDHASARLPGRLAARVRAGKARAVDEAWLEQCLALGARPPESKFPPAGGVGAAAVAAAGGSPASHSASADSLSAGSVGTAGAAAAPALAPAPAPIALRPRKPLWARWLGHWRPEYDEMLDAEIVLQANYSKAACERLGNEWLVALCNELYKYEAAVDGIDLTTAEAESGGAYDEVNVRALPSPSTPAAGAALASQDPPRTLSPASHTQPPPQPLHGASPATSSSASHNRPRPARSPSPQPHPRTPPRRSLLVSLTRKLSRSLSRKGSGKQHDRALRYSRLAAAVRACQYKLTRDMTLTKDHMPFIGPVGAAQLNDMLRTGTTEALDCFRSDQPVRTSAGVLRPETKGGATRARFKKLPGVGPATAKRWFDLGLRTYEDVEAAARPGGVLGPDGPRPINPEQLFSLTHRRDLVLEDATREDLQEMEAAVLAALRDITGETGWMIVNVGGGRRGLPSHDGDFVISHPGKHSDMIHLVRPLTERLVAAGRVIPEGTAMFRVQEGRMPTHINDIRAYVASHSRIESTHNLSADRFDRFFGMFKTSAGKARRMDLILVPHEEWPFGLLGWTGSRQWLRYLRFHATQRNMYLNSHRLLREEGGQAYLVPEERPPYDRAKRDWWPAGWAPGRKVESEADILALLGVPYREPHERNCP